MNPRLATLQPYPFEKLSALVAGVAPPAGMRPIRLSIGEPQHPTPALVTTALVDHLEGLSVYPTTAGMDGLRDAIARWCTRRFRLDTLDPGTQVLPVNGTREALFAFAQCVIDARIDPLVCCPNPFYQIYEGAALLAGAEPVFLNQTRENRFGLEFDSLPRETWARVQMVYVCSPGNPTGRVISLDEWRTLFELSNRFGFVIASDECYSEIYFDEDAPPIGGLEAAHWLGYSGYERLVVFGSLSKRSNAPGLRSGFVAGDAVLLREFLRYRTYHGGAMGPAVQHASLAAWRDETHVRDNRTLYREKFSRVVPMLQPVMGVEAPDAGFYLWAQVPARWSGDDAAFARDLLQGTNVAVLPGRYLAREAHGINPGDGFVRMALVASVDECVEAADRIVRFCQSNS